MKRNIITVPIRKLEEGSVTFEQDLLAVEEPLEIRLGERNVAITMRTPGNDEELALGFLFTEGILRDRNQVAEVAIGDRNRVIVTLRDESGVDFERLERNFYVSSSCGVCGKASIQAVEAIGCPILTRNAARIDAGIIHALPEKLRANQRVFDRTGGLHAAGIFDNAGQLIDVREDVGRHNALDKLIGAALLKGAVPLENQVLMVSGRVSFELVQKALMASIPVMAAVGAPSSLAVELALRYGMTLIGFVRDRRFNIYSGAARVN